MPPSIPNSFFCDTISITEIENAINKIKSKNSSGSDPFNAKFILEFSKYLVQPLHFIYNRSVSSSVYPSLLKIAKVIPIYKKGEHSSVGNYRPISLLNTFGKIFESIICNRLTKFFTKYNVFYKYQFGFRQNYSTKLALLDSVDEIMSALSTKEYVAAIFSI